MKKELLAFLLLVVLGVQAQDKFTVEGHLKNIADGTVFHLLKEEGLVGCFVASDTLRNGMFRFETVMKSEGLEEYSLMAVDPKNFPSMTLDLWIRPGSHLDSWTGYGKGTLKQKMRAKLTESSR